MPNLKKLLISKPKNKNLNLKELSKLLYIKLIGFSHFSDKLSLKHDNLEILDIHLNVYGDKESVFDSKCISGLTNLKALKLSSTCKVKSIDLNYDFLSSLESLALHLYHIFPPNQILLSKLCNLKTLNLYLSIR